MVVQRLLDVESDGAKGSHGVLMTIVFRHCLGSKPLVIVAFCQDKSMTGNGGTNVNKPKAPSSILCHFLSYKASLFLLDYACQPFLSILVEWLR